MKILTMDMNFKAYKKKYLVMCDMRKETRTSNLKEKKKQ
jgi:hypothetical protein